MLENDSKPFSASKVFPWASASRPVFGADHWNKQEISANAKVFRHNFGLSLHLGRESKTWLRTGGLCEVILHSSLSRYDVNM